ncbi:MAG: DUF1826 domain-containing protein [Sphingomonadales bacterium]
MNGSSGSLVCEAAAPSVAEGEGIEVSDTVDGLGFITRPSVELVIWRRALPLGLKTWLDRLEASRLPDIHFLAQPTNPRQAIEPLLDDSDMPKGDMRNMLVSDIHDLVVAFARITRTDLVDVRLERIRHDACWKFHRDCVEARLLTTYRGPTTEWVQPRHATAAVHEQKRFTGPVERMQIHDVAIFKGSCAGSGRGIVHRSPPVSGTGRTRLLLCLNMPSAVSAET